MWNSFYYQRICQRFRHTWRSFVVNGKDLCLSGVCGAFLGIAQFATGCSAASPTRDYGTMKIVDRHGEMTVSSSQLAVQLLAAAGDENSMPQLVADIGSLSDVPIYMDNTVRLLIDGPATYEAMLAAIDEAERYVMLETYIFADDEAGRRFAELLAAKSENGVSVLAVYDSFGSIGNDDSFFEMMRSSGVELIEYNKFNPVEGGNPLKLNNRNHRKLLVIDGVVAFTGGINLSSTYSSRSTGLPKKNPAREGWRDTHIQIRGPAVQGFEKTFLDQWRELGGSEIPTMDESVNVTGAGNEIVAVLKAEGGDGKQSAIFAAYLDAMRLAEERIWITQAYFAPDKEFLQLLASSAQRGVDVRLLAPGLSDSAMVLSASRSRYGDLLEAGVRIFENQNAVLHAKTAVIDGFWSTVGSSNLDYRSFLHNDEVNAIVIGKEFGLEMEKQFLQDMTHAREIELQEWNDRSLWSKIREKLSWTIEYWL
jgi:cardiolipin synthase